MTRPVYDKSPWRPLLTDDADEKDDLSSDSLANVDLAQHAHAQQPPLPTMPKTAPAPVTWMALPRKGQLAILFLSRFVDFLQVASLQAYVFYQLKAIDRNGSTAPRSDAAIATQAGLLQGCFTGAQVLTAMLWGKASDASWCGRKPVLCIGLLGTAVSCIGYGFATTFFWAAFWRAVGGGINGTVGIIRTMISEIIQDKKYQSRAFLILPMSFNLANMLGPVMGGFLADPAYTLPRLFGEGAVFGFRWIHDYPFALPSVLNAVSLGLSAMVVLFCLEETSKERRGKFDYGLYLTARFQQIVLRRRPADGYTRVGSSDVTLESVPMLDVRETLETLEKPVSQKRLPFRRIWTRNVILTLVSTALYDFHLGAFANVWALFLSTPRATEGSRESALAHGLGMPASRVGVATSFLGVLGMLLQLTLYPPISARLGTLRSFRWFSVGFPVAYFAAPLLAVLPVSLGGAVLWLGILVVLLLQVTARTFTLPASIILLNNCSPHPSVLGTVHGLGQSTSAGFRTIGPVVGGWWYGWGLQHGAVEAGWWGVAAMSVLGCIAALWIYEGSGHEIALEDEEADEQGR